jgi:hypothetical protein
MVPYHMAAPSQGSVSIMDASDPSFAAYLHNTHTHLYEGLPERHHLGRLGRRQRFDKSLHAL